MRDHHERIDGSGYPEGLIGAQVQEFPRIAAVADVYDAVTSERVYKPAAPPHVGVRVIREGSGTQFCPNVVRHFRAVVMPYPVGHEIVLPDGRSGVVAAVDIDDPDSPTVRVKGGAGVDEFVGRHGRRPPRPTPRPRTTSRRTAAARPSDVAARSRRRPRALRARAVTRPSCRRIVSAVARGRPRRW